MAERRLTMRKRSDAIATLVDELNELRLFGMAASLEDLYHSSDFNALDRISFLQRLIEPEYEAKTSLRYKNRLKRAHLTGGPQEYNSCHDSTERKYLPEGVYSGRTDHLSRPIRSPFTENQINRHGVLISCLRGVRAGLTRPNAQQI